MMQFNLCMADCAGNSKNCLYPYPITVTDPDVLRASATMDHVCGMYKNNYRYLEGLSFDKIARKMRMARSTVYRKHDSALEHVQMPENPIILYTVQKMRVKV